MRFHRLAIVALLVSAPALSGEPEKPITQKDVTAGDVAATPLTDLNLRKGQIPPLLIAAEENPYTLQGFSTCQQVASAIGELDAVLGEDVDLPREDGQRITVGQAAQYAVGSFIPFRDVIRAVSGASKREKELQAAILAGFTRRSFLKGIGQARGCRYPARSVTPELFAQRQAEIEAKKGRASTSAAPVGASTPASGGTPATATLAPPASDSWADPAATAATPASAPPPQYRGRRRGRLP